MTIISNFIEFITLWHFCYMKLKTSSLLYIIVPLSGDGGCNLKFDFLFQTGPKGVINDWRRFKQLENERKAEAEQEKLQLMKKLSITCRSHVNTHVN